MLLAVLTGGACGLLGVAFALPTVPCSRSRGRRRRWTCPRPGTVLAVLALALAGLGLVAWLCGIIVAARARLSRVREVL